jgi:hypothetical protein
VEAEKIIQMTNTARTNKKKIIIILLLVVVCILPLLNLYNQHRVLQNQTSLLPPSLLATLNEKAKAYIPSSPFVDELHFVVQYVPGAVDCGGCDALNEMVPSLQGLGFHVHGENWGNCPLPERITHIPLNRTLVFIHPEGDHMNCVHLHQYPNRSTIIVRWILAPPGVNTDPLPTLGYNRDDLVFSYGPNMIENASLSNKNIVMVIKNPFAGDETDIPDELFYNKNRSGILWTMRKGHAYHSNITYIHEQPGMTSTNIEREKPINVAELVKYEYFVSYDPLTYLSVLAAMSGTVSIVYPVAGQTKEQWSMGSFLGPYLRETGKTVIPGIAYGWTESEILFSRQTMHQLRPFLVDMKRWGVETTVARMARDCYRYKNGTRTNFEAGLLVTDAFPSLFKQGA